MIAGYCECRDSSPGFLVLHVIAPPQTVSPRSTLTGGFFLVGPKSAVSRRLSTRSQWSATDFAASKVYSGRHLRAASNEQSAAHLRANRNLGSGLSGLQMSSQEDICEPIAIYKRADSGQSNSGDEKPKPTRPYGGITWAFLVGEPAAWTTTTEYGR